MIAIITHKGAAADAGHYIGFAKKSVFHPKASQATEPDQRTIDDDDDDWYKFDDEKVSVFPAEKLATLDGGGSYLFCDRDRRSPSVCVFWRISTNLLVSWFVGEDASAYVLLYKTKSLA